MRARVASCRLFNGLLKIDSALTLIRFTRRDDADDFFAIDIVLTVSSTTNRSAAETAPIAYQSLFAVNNTVGHKNHTWVVERARCTFEVQAVMFDLIGSIFPHSKRTVMHNV